MHLNWNEILQSSKGNAEENYDIISNLHKTSLSSTKDNNNNDWFLKYCKDADQITIINFDEFKDWYCDKFFAFTGDASKKKIPQTMKVQYGKQKRILLGY